MLSDQVPKVEELAADDVRQRLPRFQSVNIEKNLGLRSALRPLRAGRTPRSPSSPSRGQWPGESVRESSSFRYPAQNRASTLRRIVRAADIVLTAEDLA